jgi:hypothetical protein
MYILYLCEKKYTIMATVALPKKRKNIDLDNETFQKLSIMASAQGKSLKAFIENLLVTKAQSLQIEVSSKPYSNPSPSGDPWFDDPENMAEVEKRLEELKNGKAEFSLELRTSEDIKNFFKSL